MNFTAISNASDAAVQPAMHVRVTGSNAKELRPNGNSNRRLPVQNEALKSTDHQSELKLNDGFEPFVSLKLLCKDW